jgi:hypothetical protein
MKSRRVPPQRSEAGPYRSQDLVRRVRPRLVSGSVRHLVADRQGETAPPDGAEAGRRHLGRAAGLQVEVPAGLAHHQPAQCLPSRSRARQRAKSTPARTRRKAKACRRCRRAGRVTSSGRAGSSTEVRPTLGFTPDDKRDDEEPHASPPVVPPFRSEPVEQPKGDPWRQINGLPDPLLCHCWQFIGARNAPSSENRPSPLRLQDCTLSHTPSPHYS